MPWASGSSLVKLTVAVWRRMYAFHASEPDSRPPPVSFSPPKAPPISAPLGPMLTFAIPQSEPEAREEPLRLAQVGGEDRRREPLRDAVLERDRLLRLGVGEHVEERREGLPLDDRGLRRHPHERRARVPGVGPLVCERPLAAGHDLAAVRPRLVERLLEPRERRRR